MPRIAASLMVVFTVAACIGFNTARYPLVWEMTASAHHFPQAAEGTGSAESHPHVVCEGDVCRIVPPSTSTPTARAPAIPNPLPLALAASKPAKSPPPPRQRSLTQPAATREDPKPPAAPAGNSAPQPAPAGLVPVTRPPVAEPAAQTPALLASAKPSAHAASALPDCIRRLPPLDRVETLDSAGQPPLPEDQIPLYPATIAR